MKLADEHRLLLADRRDLTNDWPPITEPRLLARLALSDDEFLAFTTRLVGSFGSREFTNEAYTRALSYPWARPGQSFVLERGQVTRLVEPPDDLIAEDSRRRQTEPDMK